MSDSENLGKTAAWQIRDFPETLRQQIAEAARMKGETVSEFVTAIMVKARDAGWFDGLQTTSNTAVATIDRQRAQVSNAHAELRQLTELARAATPPDKDSVALQLARRQIAARLKALDPT